MDLDGNPPSPLGCKPRMLVQHLRPILPNNDPPCHGFCSLRSVQYQVFLCVSPMGPSQMRLIDPRRMFNTSQQKGVGVTGGTCAHLTCSTDRCFTTKASVTFDPQFLSEEISGEFVSRAGPPVCADCYLKPARFTAVSNKQKCGAHCRTCADLCGLQNR